KDGRPARRHPAAPVVWGCPAGGPARAGACAPAPVALHRPVGTTRLELPAPEKDSSFSPALRALGSTGSTRKQGKSIRRSGQAVSGKDECSCKQSTRL